MGAGFAGIGCAKELAKRHDVHVTLLDKHNYHQFLPLLYQVATYQLSPTDVAMDLRQEFRKHPRVSVKMGEVASIDPAARVATLADGGTFAGDYIVLAAGSQANFFDTPGAEHVFPLYSLDDAERLRSRVLAIFEDADRDPSLVDKGALNIVIVGCGRHGNRGGGGDRRTGARRAAVGVPRPRRRQGPRDRGRSRRRGPRPVLTEGPRIRVQGPARPRRRTPPGDVGEGDRSETTWCCRTARRSSPTASSGAAD